MAFNPVQAAVGGLFIGTACGVYMFCSSRVAGCSGAVKAAVVGPREPTKLAFLSGLAGGGALMSRLAPHLFERPPAVSVALGLAGLGVGLGVTLGNGCTSGHGLCGMSRLSLRSFTAVPTFMATAILTATLVSGRGFADLQFVPAESTPGHVLEIASKLAVGLGLASIPCFFGVGEVYTGLWSGTCFAVGLAIGGMVRPSVITGGLSPGNLDLTLWTLFVTALITTFIWFRAAARKGVAAATAVGGKSSQPQPDAKLLLGASLFGIGWGASGFCPGPLLVGIGANPTAPGLQLFLGALCLGMFSAEPVFGRFFQ